MANDTELDIKMDIHPDLAHCRAAADYIRSRLSFTPELGIILGSGLGPLAETVDTETIIDYRDIPGFPISTVSSHIGRLICGTLCGVKVLCMQGRVHYYEGYSFEDLAMAVRVMALAGIKCLIVTNAAGAVNLNYKPGDIMIISDHINLCGVNPVRGPYYKDFGERFYDVTNLYHKGLRSIARECAKRSDLTVHEGTYMFLPGPNFETPAEIRAARMLGADAVGMSTVPEALTAGHMGIPVLGFSVMTNMAAGILPAPLSDEEVCETSRMISEKFSGYVDEVIRKMNQVYGKDARKG